MSQISTYLDLCKIKVVALMILCAWVGMLLAHDQLPAISIVIFGSLGIALASASGAALNHVIDRHIDARMQRTQQRPLPQHHISVKNALLFAVILGSIGLSILWFYVNSTAAAWTLATLLGYGLIYTALLKRITSQNIVIGGLSGALPPLLGWVCVEPHLTAEPWLLVLIIFAWTPPHFWALAIAKIKDYEKSQLPMLPVTHGVAYTKLNIILYTWLLVAATGLPFAIGMLGVPYLVASQLLNLRFIYWTYQLYRSQSPHIAYQTFIFSIKYLFALFVLMLIDHFSYAISLA